jgi:hypothetical protein
MVIDTDKIVARLRAGARRALGLLELRADVNQTQKDQIEIALTLEHLYEEQARTHNALRALLHALQQGPRETVSTCDALLRDMRPLPESRPSAPARPRPRQPTRYTHQ